MPRQLVRYTKYEEHYGCNVFSDFCPDNYRDLICDFVFYSSISYSFSFLYRVLSLMPRSSAASFLLLLCFFNAFTINSFSLSMMLRLSSTSSCSCISLFMITGCIACGACCIWGTRND